MPLSDELQTEVAGSVPSDDPRWQVIERIINSPCFQRSERLKAFLKYIAQQYLSGHVDRLTGHQIGCAVFAKSAGHDQPDDNTVRIYARQLRLRLLEYFDRYGREEPYIVEIPKGSYVPVFRLATPPVSGTAPVESTPDGAAIPEPAQAGRSRNAFAYSGWIVAAALGFILLFALFRSPHSTAAHSQRDSAFELWPLSELSSTNDQTQIVLCDNGFALYQVAVNHRFTLSDYLKPEYPQNMTSHVEPKEVGLLELMDQLGRKQITAYADASITAHISHLDLPGTWVTRPSRDIKLREVQEGNYVFLGSPWANPWVELYEPRLNFVLTKGVPLGIINRHPKAGEPSSYMSQGRTGTIGDDYAAIAVIPNEKRGIVMIVQGTKEEGTEAAGMLLADPAGRRRLRNSLGLKTSEPNQVFFEALMRTKTFAGASAETQIVAARRLVPSN